MQNKPIYVFYHTFLMGNYKLVIQEQLQKIFLSGLYNACAKLFIYTSAPSGMLDNIEWLKKITKPFDKITISILDVDKTNLPADYRESKITLQFLEKFANENPGYYCFLHTKGIYNQGYNMDMWRISCDWSTIVNWEKNINLLQSNIYDAVGPNLRYNTFIGYYPHFSGNYWWSTDDHIKTLNSDYLTDIHNKYLEEFWIGSNHSAKLGSIYECGHEAPYLITSEIDSFIKT